MSKPDYSFGEFYKGHALSADQIRELYSGGIKTLNGLAIASVKSFNGIG